MSFLVPSLLASYCCSASNCDTKHVLYPSVSSGNRTNSMFPSFVNEPFESHRTICLCSGTNNRPMTCSEYSAVSLLYSIYFICSFMTTTTWTASLVLVTSFTFAPYVFPYTPTSVIHDTWPGQDPGWPKANMETYIVIFSLIHFCTLFTILLIARLCR